MNDQTDSRNGSSLATSLADWWRGLRRNRAGENALREAIDELIEEHDASEIPMEKQERILLENITQLHDRTVCDVLVPRADIIALEVSAQFSEVIETLVREGHSRMPVFRETLDDAIGMVHIKDLLPFIEHRTEFDLSRIVRRVLFVPPSMRVLELLLEMRVTRCHMALVVDEFGGIDGLVSIEDLVEEIVGEIEDEHDHRGEISLIRSSENVYQADARIDLKEFEKEIGEFLNEDERRDIDTLGGLVFALAGHVPSRGELITHPAGVEFEVLDADPRRIRRVRVRHIISK